MTTREYFERWHRHLSASHSQSSVMNPWIRGCADSKNASIQKADKAKRLQRSALDFWDLSCLGAAGSGCVSWVLKCISVLLFLSRKHQLRSQMHIIFRAHGPLKQVGEAKEPTASIFGLGLSSKSLANEVLMGCYYWPLD